MVTLDKDPEHYTSHKRSRDTWLQSVYEHEDDKNAKRVIIVDPVPIDPGDIQIGAVEIKNATTDDRAIVYTDGSLKVRSSVAPSKFYQNEKNVSATTTDTLLIQTPSVDNSLNSMIVGGNGDGEFILKINTVKVLTVRNRITQSQVIIPLNGLFVNSGEAIEIEVINLKNQSRFFESTIIYNE